MTITKDAAEFVKCEQDKRYRHGGAATPTYVVWSGMKRRCAIPTSSGYFRYGGRGIKVCERWMSFANFLADMGERPLGTFIERIDNDGPYSPENCKWATRAEQNRNTRRTKKITFNGTTLCLKDWARKLRLCPDTLKYRLKTWTLDEALSAPPDLKKQKRKGLRMDAPSTVALTCNGITLSRKEWAKRLGVDTATIYRRLQKMSVEEVLSPAFEQPQRILKKAE